MSRISSGMQPVIRLRERFRVLNTVNFAMSFGISPKRLFRLKSMESREVQRDIEVGISPLMCLLALMLILAKLGKSNSSLGISSESLFNSSDKVCRFLRLPIAGGIFPVILLLESLRIPRASPEILGGSSPEK
ncbi:hypothetical protein CIPAW_07G147800 [Carya illinoinensis]|uniref:Uncharacterized protein n=1 Tax=Carya illinoinensis TaxID=32201 RepID=A0A8T1PW56_CARIL|nr:hypothetical protein CIPAW_07G147800 [Carya illinoinensis]